MIVKAFFFKERNVYCAYSDNPPVTCEASSLTVLKRDFHKILLEMLEWGSRDGIMAVPRHVAVIWRLADRHDPDYITERIMSQLE